MIRSFKYRLYPNKHQEQVLNVWLEQCCKLYNAALEQRIAAYKKQHKRISKYDQHKDLTELRKSDADWAAVSVTILRSAIDRLDESFQGFFRRCRTVGKSGFPRFRSLKRYNSFSIGHPKLSSNRIYVPKLGHVKLNLYRPIQGIIKNVRIKRDSCNKWWVSFCCDIGQAPVKTIINSEIGIDLGLTSFATLSNGEHIENPRYFKISAEKLAQRQRKLAKKRKGSKSYEKQRILVAKSYQKIKNQRLDHARKLAVDLYSKYDLIAYENLNIKGMVQGNLGKSIYDAGWGIFAQALALKAENAGKHCVGVNPKGTTQRCSSCDVIVKKTLSDRWHSCSCGISLNRDHNAALNIIKLARSVPSKFKSTLTGVSI